MTPYVTRIKQTYLRGDIFEKTNNAKQWFINKMTNIDIRPKDVFQESVQLTSPEFFGKMYFFSYDPKTKKELPYYDTFPLIVPIKPLSKGFLGMNMHYLDPYTRAMLFDALRSKNHSRLYFAYDRIKKIKYTKPCIKQYLNDHVTSRFVEVPWQEWVWVLYLPLERFQKMNKYNVWLESREMIEW